MALVGKKGYCPTDHHGLHPQPLVIGLQSLTVSLNARQSCYKIGCQGPCRVVDGLSWKHLSASPPTHPSSEPSILSYTSVGFPYPNTTGPFPCGSRER